MRWTASRVVGRLQGVHDITVDLRQAKAASAAEKHVRFLSEASEALHEIDLNESGSAAHARMLSVLLRPEWDCGSRAGGPGMVRAGLILRRSRSCAATSPCFRGLLRDPHGCGPLLGSRYAAASHE
jgi:hypothetical protein